MISLPLWQHQREALAKAGKKFALFFDPGTGKTRTAIELFKREARQSSNQGHWHKAIIFTPLNVCRNWENELKEYLGENFRVYLVAGQLKKQKLKAFDDFKRHGVVTQATKHAFLVCNIESLRSEQYVLAIAASMAKFIIVDESHNFKSPTSAQTKGLFELVNLLKPSHLYLLTGTPAPQGEIDLWSTLSLLEKTKDNFFIWRKRHFVDRNEKWRGKDKYFPKYEITPTGKAAIHQALAECSLTARKNEVLDLPELLRVNLYADMSPIQKRHYDTMKTFLFAIDADGNELNAANLLSRTLRLQQILAGVLGDVLISDNPRLSVFDSAVELTGTDQFIVWTIFQPTYQQLGDRLAGMDISYGFLTGEQSAAERAETMASFQAGEIRAIIAHPKAGGVGVNLTAASYSIHYTRNFNLVDDLQAEARNHRGGSERHERITRIDILTPDTIDENITKALKEKKSVQDFILELKQQKMGVVIDGE